MPSENVADRLIRDFVAWVRQSASDTVISPTGVVAGEANNQICDFGAGSRPAWIRTILRAIELLSHELSEPTENRFGLSRCSNLLEAFSAKPFADFREC